LQKFPIIKTVTVVALVTHYFPSLAIISKHRYVNTQLNINKLIRLELSAIFSNIYA